MPMQEYPMALDANGFPIQGATYLKDVLNVSVNSSTWTEIELVFDEECKFISMKLRDASAWKFSHLALGTRYYSVSTVYNMDFVKCRGTAKTIFYVQAAGDDKVLEIAVWD